MHYNFHSGCCLLVCSPWHFTPLHRPVLQSAGETAYTAHTIRGAAKPGNPWPYMALHREVLQGGGETASTAQTLMNVRRGWLPAIRSAPTRRAATSAPASLASSWCAHSLLRAMPACESTGITTVSDVLTCTHLAKCMLSDVHPKAARQPTSCFHWACNCPEPQFL